MQTRTETLGELSRGEAKATLAKGKGSLSGRVGGSYLWRSRLFREFVLKSTLATVVIGALYLAGFYYFCCQLAEHGW